MPQSKPMSWISVYMLTIIMLILLTTSLSLFNWFSHKFIYKITSIKKIKKW